MRLNNQILCSFCSGYNDRLYLNKKIKLKKKFPSLIQIKNNKIKKFSYIFPRNLEDFKENKKLIVGDKIPPNIKDFKRLPRFGFTGLANNRDYIFAGSWNGIYKIKKKNFKLECILSNKLTSDIHGVYYYNNKIYSTLSYRDTVVATDLKGEIKETYTILNDLSIKKNDKDLLKIDWRFVTKQMRGPTGFFHFNHIRVESEKIYLTSRNLGAVIKVNTKSKKTSILPLGHMKTSLIHDGKKKNSKLYFTSVDGKIIIVDEKKKKSNQERLNTQINSDIFNYSYAIDYFKIDRMNLKRTPNWCRGIEILDKNKIIVTLDGIYGTKHFSITLIDIKKNKILKEFKISFKTLDNNNLLRFVSGFDLLVLN